MPQPLGARAEKPPREVRLPRNAGHLATCLAAGRASLPSPQMKSSSLWFWKLLPRLLVILSKQDGLTTKQELARHPVELGKLRRVSCRRQGGGLGD